MSNSTTPSMGASTGAQQFRTPAHSRLSHAWIDEWLPKLGKSAFAVYLVLYKHRGKKGIFPGHERIAAATGLSVSTVKRALKTLAVFELVSWKPRREATKRGKSRQLSNEYFLSKNDPHPQSKLTHKLNTETYVSVGDAPLAPEPLTAAEESELQGHGVTEEKINWFARRSPAAARHALKFIAVKAKYFARVPSKAGLLVSIMRAPEKYPLSAVAKANPPAITAEAQDFINAMPKVHRETLRAWAATDPAFAAIMDCWRSMNAQARARLAVESEYSTTPFWPLMQEIATAG